ncbi:hypothetical protein PM082_021162 [Marasmius tenuissimus]|nr:hypothetical protein PM082_021162 [Marasmius tenuissimus]
MDPDDITYLLIAQLHLQDVDLINHSRKGKAKQETPLTDEEYAFQLQAELVNSFLGVMEDKRIAESLGAAIDTDLRLVEQIATREQAEEDDHRYAAALSRGEPLPEKSDAQRRVEHSEVVQRRRFPPQATDHGNATASGSNSTQGTSGSTTCVICMDRIPYQRAFHAAACGHYYCRVCLVDLVQACTRDESLYPLRCCKQNLSLPGVLPFLDTKTRINFQIKAREFDIQPNNRLYCTNPVCSTFLGSNTGGKRTVTCTTCFTTMCTGCKKASHLGECTENEAFRQLQALAREEGWQTCPGCRRIIDLHHGCFHMTCKCGTQFCYLCAAPWKNCGCPQWDEGRLITTARLRLQQEMGPRIEPNAAVVERQVQQRVQELRTYHNCDPHRWRHRQGGGQCEECGFYLPLFLKACRGCFMLACVRCTRNRL